MRIFFISSFPTPNDGVSDYTKDIIDGVGTLGVDIDSAKVEHPFRFPYRTTWAPIIQRIQKQKPDAVHIQYTPTSVGPGIQSAVKKLHQMHVPVILTVHEKPDFFIDRLPRPLVKPYLLWERKLFKAVDHLIVHTQDQYVDIRIRYDVQPSNITVIPHYIQDTPALGKNEKFRLVSLGRIVPKKRLDLVIEALGQLKATQPEVSLLVVGQAPDKYQEYAEQLKALAEQLGVTDQVQWTGYVKETDLPQLLSPHDVAVLPYLMATQSGAAFKVLSHNVPLLTNNLPAFEELIGRFSVGLSRPLHSAEHIAAAVTDILKHPEWQAEWQQHIQRLKLAQSLGTIAQLHLNLYTRVCQNTLE